jgi:hypothetical protein
VNYDQAIEQAACRVEEAEARIRRQIELVQKLSRKRRPTALAEQLLATMVCTAATLRSHRDMLERRRARSGPAATRPATMPDLSAWDAEDGILPVDLEYWRPESSRPH